MWVDCMLCDFYLITTIFNLKKYFKPGVWFRGNACLAWGPEVNPWHHKRKFKSYGGEETLNKVRWALDGWRAGLK